MGFLTEGTTLAWEEAHKYAEYIRTHGITQFLNIYRNNRDRHNESLLWGDEVEYMVIKLDHEHQVAKLALTGHIATERLDELDRQNPGHSSWKPEYAKYMVEGTPGKPFGENWRDFLHLEQNMKERRELMSSVLGEGEVGITLPNFPLLGTVNSTWPETRPNGPVANSLYTSDDLIHPHHRFSTLTRNIRIRRGSNVAINVPIYKDEQTVMPEYRKEREELGRSEAKDGSIYMDSMAFGMGMHCLQCTFQTCNVREARSINDHLAVLAPIMLVLTAGTPILKGLLSDCDVRWQVISASVDDRTPAERGLAPLEANGHDAGTRLINKSRYDSIDSYLSLDQETYRTEYDDLNLIYDENIYKRLMGEGIDHLLARHLAHLFIRDPLVIYSDKIEIDDTKLSDHFENIQSTNWQTVRFKPPPPNAPIGWRVEFRPMEIQLTDFENAAFVVFIVILTRVMCAFGINLYLPISKVDENMKRAHARDAVLNQKFYWRKSIVRKTPKTDGCHKPDLTPSNFNYKALPPGSPHLVSSTNIEDEYQEMTINEILNGKDDYSGLIPLVNHYLDNVSIDMETRVLLNDYLGLISKRASGELQTLAAWQRSFVLNHPAYKKDSVVNPKITYDLITRIADIEAGKIGDANLLGTYWPRKQ